MQFGNKLFSYKDLFLCCKMKNFFIINTSYKISFPSFIIYSIIEILNVYSKYVKKMVYKF